MTGQHVWNRLAFLLGILVLHSACAGPLLADEGATNSLRAGASTSHPGNDVADEEARLAERFRRLELLAGRLAELSRSTQPRRAELLRQLVARSREGDLPGQFDTIVVALKEDRLAEAVEKQGTLEPELQAMLELLLQEDRDRQLESERKRIEKYLADLNKLIRAQRGIKGRTDGGDEEEQLAEEQERLADSTGKLGEEIEATEGQSKTDDSGQDGDPSDSPGDSPSDSDSRPSEDSPGDSAGDAQQPAEGDSQQSDQPASPGEPSEGELADGEPSDGEPSDGASSEGEPSDSPSPGAPSDSSSKSSPGQPSDDEGSDEQQAEQDRPADRATQRLRQAQQRMQQAQERLEEAEREQASEKQEEALRELEQAKAELERILRQLREEEMERMLVLLEARLRKMLEAQNEVYEQTKVLASTQANAPQHEVEIASSRLSRREELIVRDADRALDLLREDGTSVAFPEALGQAREDMLTVVDRLRDTKLDVMTVGLEEDIIATLEETLAALQQALKDLRQQRGSEGEAGGEPGEPGEQPLVDQLAELRMIRALQVRINNRTELYDRLLEGERALEQDLLEALRKLSERQQQIFDATRDLHQGTNR